MADMFSILAASYKALPQPSIPAGSKFANVDPTLWQGTWTAKDTSGKAVTLKIMNVSGYRATVRFEGPTGTGGLQTGRVFINTNGVFRIGTSQMQLTGAGKMTISTVITDAATGKQRLETDQATLQDT